MTLPEWFLAICLVSFFVFVLLCLRAPVGSEGEDGFRERD
jgi:hypothetical protein